MITIFTPSIENISDSLLPLNDTPTSGNMRRVRMAEK